MSKPIKLSLAGYVRRRNGVPLGHKDSLPNMLRHSFGAASFDRFWLYWNPIWGYYLGRWFMQPAGRILPAPLAVWFALIMSGAAHDIAASLVKMRPLLLFTTWFTVMGAAVVLVQHFGWAVPRAPFWLRSAINLAWLIATFSLAQILQPPGF